MASVASSDDRDLWCLREAVLSLSAILSKLGAGRSSILRSRSGLQVNCGIQKVTCLSTVESNTAHTETLDSYPANKPVQKICFSHVLK